MLCNEIYRVFVTMQFIGQVVTSTLRHQQPISSDVRNNHDLSPRLTLSIFMR